MNAISGPAVAAPPERGRPAPQEELPRPDGDVSVPSEIIAARPIWRELKEGGYLASTSAAAAPLPPPFRQGLMQVHDQLADAGVTFVQPQTMQPLSHRAVIHKLVTSPGRNEVALRTPNTQPTTVQCLAALQIVDALYCTGDVLGIIHAPLAYSIYHIGRCGQKFYHGDHEAPCDQPLQEIDRFGAFLQLGQDRGAVVTGSGIPPSRNKGWTADTELRSEEDAVATAFFNFNGPPLVELPDLAKAVRALGNEGYTFKDPTDGAAVTPRDVWTRVARLDSHIDIGLAGVPLESVKVRDLVYTSSLSTTLREVARLYRDTILPRAQSGSINETDTAWLVSTCYESMADPLVDTVDKRWAVVEDLRRIERRHKPADQAVSRAIENLRFVGTNREATESLESALDEFKLLLTAMPGNQAQSVFDMVRGDLRRRTVDEADYRERRAALMELALIVRDANVLKEVDQLLDFDIPGVPRDERTRLFTALRKLEEPWGESWESARHAVEDYKLIVSDACRVPDQPLIEAANAFETLSAALRPKASWEAVRDSFMYVQRGTRLGRFEGRSAERALQDFLKVYLVKRDLQEARAALLKPPRDPRDRTLELTSDEVTIEGLTVPRRS